MKEKFLIGIAAPTCAGKTSLLNELKENLGDKLAVVNFDDYDRFYTGSSEMDAELDNPTITNWEDPKLFNYQKFIRDLGKLKNGLSIILDPYSRENQKPNTTVRKLSPTEFTIVEGIFVLHYPAARLLFDLKYYVDIPEETMVKRRISRYSGGKMPWDQLDYIKGPMIEGTRKYVAPQKKVADKVLDGTKPSIEIAEQVIFDIKHLRR
jgi:uridine kinase